MLGNQRDSQGCDVGQKDELAHPLKGEALKVFQPEVTLDPGEMLLDIRAGLDHQTPPLEQEKRLGQFALASPSQVVVHVSLCA